MSRKIVSYVKEGFATLIVSVVFSLILVLISAMVFKITALDTAYVTVFNTVIKVLSVIFAVIVCFKTPADGWIRGIISGVVFAFASYLVYGLISSDLSFGLGFFADIGLGAVSGLIAGIVAVNIRRKTA